jgi:2-dehydropantoate 2-reductase
MKVCVFGVGAVGGYLCVQLARSPLINTLNVVARGLQLEAIQTKGLVVKDAQGAPDECSRVHQASENAHELGQHDLVIVTLKANTIAQCAQDINALTSPQGVIVFVNNGIPWWWDYPEKLVDHGQEGLMRSVIWQSVKPERVLGCVAMSNNEVLRPGVIQHNSMNKWYLGEPNGEMSQRLDQVVNLFASAGLGAAATPNIKLEVWRKLLLNIPNHALASLTRLPTDEIYSQEGLIQWAIDLTADVSRVASCYGFDLGETSREVVLNRLKPNVKGSKPSMLQDVLKNKELEIDAVFGSVIELAKRNNTPIPSLIHAYALLQGLNRHLTLSR